MSRWKGTRTRGGERDRGLFWFPGPRSTRSATVAITQIWQRRMTACGCANDRRAASEQHSCHFAASVLFSLFALYLFLFIFKPGDSTEYQTPRGGNLWDEEVCLKEIEKKKKKSSSKAPREAAAPLLVEKKKKRRERERKKKSTPVIVLRAGSRRRLELFLETLESLQTASSP